MCRVILLTCIKVSLVLYGLQRIRHFWQSLRFGAAEESSRSIEVFKAASPTSDMRGNVTRRSNVGVHERKKGEWDAVAPSDDVSSLARASESHTPNANLTKSIKWRRL
jgi:hypothetical protein